jgi:hypothetical protein
MCNLAALGAREQRSRRAAEQRGEVNKVISVNATWYNSKYEVQIVFMGR